MLRRCLEHHQGIPQKPLSVYFQRMKLLADDTEILTHNNIDVTPFTFLLLPLQTTERFRLKKDSFSGIH
jgi:hypothetical protein